MSILLKNIIILTNILLLLSSCGSPGNEKVQGNETKRDSGIVLNALQVKNAAITFGTITRQRLSFDIRAKGKLSMPPDHEASVGSMMEGVVEDILVKPGEHVYKGKVLAMIASPGIIKLQQDYLSAESRYRVIESEYKRQKELKHDGITSERSYLEAEAAFSDVQSSREALRLNLELLNINVSDVQKGKIKRSAPILSPIMGEVEHIHLNLGKFVAQNDVLFTVVNKNHLFLELMVFEKDIPYVKTGQRVTFELANLGEKGYEAHVVTIARTVEEDARTVRVLADFINDSPFILPGMFVAAEIHTAEQEVDALPEEAIVEDQDGAYCFYTHSALTDKELRFFRLPLKTGFREDNLIQVHPLTPLPSDARIVVTGTYFIRAEGLKSAE